MLKPIVLTLLFLCIRLLLPAQQGFICGRVMSGETPIAGATIRIPATRQGTTTDAGGWFQLIPAKGNYRLHISATGYTEQILPVTATGNRDTLAPIILSSLSGELDQVVVSGSLRPVQRSQSPIPIEVYTPAFFRANPSPTLLESLQQINGVRAQSNCNVCNTGDIRLNGLDGPYTMVLIDGIPIVSGLATVYGFQGIPQSLIERVEVVKGPASTLYGSEAVGGLINIITKQPGQHQHPFSADLMITGYGERNVDLAAAFRPLKKVNALAAINYFNYDRPVDKNGDGFTDLTLANRISLFQKWQWQRKQNRLLTIAGRYLYEDRWGGQTGWGKDFRAGDSLYGESIYTGRWELIGQYQLPVRPKLIFQLSANGHRQNSAYGNQLYLADQRILFGQLLWYQSLHSHQLLTGLVVRHTYYDDNTPATAASSSKVTLPGLFVQDDWTITPRHSIVLGLRYDHHPVHGSVVTPRWAYKFSTEDKRTVLRLNVGSGYRVANVFTEDHAALTGARKVVFTEALKPERSWNVNAQWSQRLGSRKTLLLETSVFYTRFANRIVANYDVRPDEIVYSNLSGHGISRGVAVSADATLWNRVKLITGATLIDVYTETGGVRSRQLFTERFSGVWTVSVPVKQWRIDYTGNVYSPMRLPLLGALDPRPAYSPWYSLQNLQLSYKAGHRFEFYGGIKNLLSYRPDRHLPFLIARSGDPFDKQVVSGPDGLPVASAQNPYALSFDPTYSYAPMQGRRWFLGVRFHVEGR